MSKPTGSMIQFNEIVYPDDDGILDHSSVRELNEALREIEAVPNEMTLAEFAEFEPLYRVPDKVANGKALVDRNVFRALSEKFCRRVDIYKEIHIYDRPKAHNGRDNGRKLLVVLPAPQMRINALRPTEQNALIASRNQGAATRAATPDHVVDDATGQLGHALLKEQLEPARLDEFRKESEHVMALVATLKQQYGTDDASASEVPAASTVIGGDEWEA